MYLLNLSFFGTQCEAVFFSSPYNPEQTSHWNKQRLIERRVRVVFSYSNIRNVSLTYLRGLEIAELNEEDLPIV